MNGSKDIGGVDALRYNHDLVTKIISNVNCKRYSLVRVL